jgi:hypothetical protein
LKVGIGRVSIAPNMSCSFDQVLGHLTILGSLG